MRPSHMPKAHVRDYFIIIIAVLFMFVLFLVPVIGLEPTKTGIPPYHNTSYFYFPHLILRNTTIIPAGVIPGMRDRSAIFSGRTVVNFSTSSLVNPGKFL